MKILEQKLGFKPSVWKVPKASGRTKPISISEVVILMRRRKALLWQHTTNVFQLCNTYKAKINKDGGNPTCRLYHKCVETIDYIVSECPVLAGKEYIIRHDRLGKYIHWHIRSMVLKSRINGTNTTRIMLQMVME